MATDRFTKSSHDRTLFDAWFGTIFAVGLALVFSLTNHESWLIRIALLLLTAGFWLRYFSTKRHPIVWVVEVDQHSVRYLRNGKLMNVVNRSDVKTLRYFTPWLSTEGLRAIKLELCNGDVHSVSPSRLNPDDHSLFVHSIHRHWGMPATDCSL